MKMIHLSIATAAVALLAGAASAQQSAAPLPGSVTGDWNGSHAPSDDKQYREKVVAPVGALPSVATSKTTETTIATTLSAPAATTAGADASTATFTNVMVTNGPVPDTAANRAKYGQPDSHAGKHTSARGN